MKLRLTGTPHQRVRVKLRLMESPRRLVRESPRRLVKVSLRRLVRESLRRLVKVSLRRAHCHR